MEYKDFIPVLNEMNKLRINWFSCREYTPINRVQKGLDIRECFYKVNVEMNRGESLDVDFVGI